MAKALVIKGVSFATNKLDTVTFVNEKSCTAIALNYATLTLANIGTTQQITATVTPSDTTDTIVWASSDIKIATVDGNGIVTVTGAGSATITATCGSQVASCSVTTTHTLTWDDSMLSAYLYGRGYGETESDKPWNHMVCKASGDANYGFIYSTTATPKEIYEITGKYPLKFGKASQIAITAPSNIKVTVQICDSTKSPRDFPDWQAEAYTAGYTAWIYSDASAFDSQVPLGNRTVQVPDGCDCIYVTLRKTTADLSATDIANIGLVAS